MSKCEGRDCIALRRQLLIACSVCCIDPSFLTRLASTVRFSLDALTVDVGIE